MKKTAMIKEIIGVPLSKYGFQYDGYLAGSWNFSRTVNNMKQYLVICQSNFCQGIRLELATELNPIWQSQAKFCPYWGEKYGYYDFQKFEDAKTFRSILEEFAEVAIQYGLDELERLSIPSPEDLRRPTVEMQQLLYENYENFSREFMKEHGLTIEDKEQGLDKIIKILKENAEAEYTDEMKLKLVHMAAYYTVISMSLYPAIIDFDGKYCMIRFRKRKFETIVLPLKDIYIGWINITDSPELLKEVFNIEMMEVEAQSKL